jgi:hypothetical protein
MGAECDTKLSVCNGARGNRCIRLFVCEYLKGKKNRKWRVHPINAVRHAMGTSGCNNRRIEPWTLQLRLDLFVLSFYSVSSVSHNSGRCCIALSNISISMGKHYSNRKWSTRPEENVIIQERESEIPQAMDVNCAPVWRAPFKDTQRCDVSEQDSTCALA